MPVTLEDIALALNVSKMTVSRAINNHPEISAQTRARILATAQKMNYRPNQFARALTTSRSYLIGIVVPDLMHSYFAEICRGVEIEARPAGYQNLICSTDEEARKEMDEIEALLSRTDGLIVASALSKSESKFYRRLLSEGANIVLIDRLLDGLSCSAVTTDDVKVGRLATEHLINLGHRKIGHLRGPNVSTALRRLQGYQDAVAKAGLKPLVHECGFTESDGYTAMQKWIAARDQPTAIFAANDPAAIGAMKAVSQARLSVPEAFCTTRLPTCPAPPVADSVWLPVPSSRMLPAPLKFGSVVVRFPATRIVPLESDFAELPRIDMLPLMSSVLATATVPAR